MHTSFVALFLNLGSGEILIIVLLFLLFFGADKIPQMARSIGRGMREMKNATADIQREIEKGAAEVQREANLSEQAATLREATDAIQGHIEEGMKEADAQQKTIEPPIDPLLPGNEPKPDNDEDKDNPLIPPNAIKR